MPECPSCGASYSGGSCPYCSRRVKDGDSYIAPREYDRNGRLRERRYGDMGTYVYDDEVQDTVSPPLTDVPTHGYMKGTPISGPENPMLSRIRSSGQDESPLKTTMAILSPKASRRMAERRDRAYDVEYDYRFGYRPPVTAKSVLGCLVSVAAVAAIIVWLVLRK